MRAERTSITGLVAVEERGIALIAALLLMMLMSALMIGFSTVVMSDQRYRGIDKDRARAFYGAQSGLEKLTVDFGNLFLTNVNPTAAQIAALANSPPSLTDVAYVAPAGVTAYGVTLTTCDNLGNTSCSAQVASGTYQGLMALKKVYILDAVARTPSGGEAHLKRKIESVAIPVFQFGTFSDVDLSFFAGPNFNFGGRVHTNGNLFLAEGDGATLTLTDKVTAVKDIVRQQMANTVLITTAASHNGTINMATAPNTFLPLAANQGSVTGGLSPRVTNPNWNTISLTTYNGYIRTGATGAKALNLPLITMGGVNTDLVRRPIKNEDTSNALLFGERMFGKVSLRILLSDTPGNITSLPTVTATAPINLGETAGPVAPDWKNGILPPGLTAVNATHPPIARSPGNWAQATFQTKNATTNGTVVNYQGVVPAVFHTPHLQQTTITGGGNTNTVTCTKVTTVDLQGCVPTANWLAEPTNSTAAVVVNGVTYQSNVTTVIAAGGVAAKTLAINGGTAPYAGTAPWGANAFFVQDNSNSATATNPKGLALFPTLVSCTGVDTTSAPPEFNGCTGVPSKVAASSLITTYALSAKDTGIVGGYIKIEMQKADFTWQDVTAEILNYGIAGGADFPANCAGNPNAIIQLQRLQNTPGVCTAVGSQDSYDYLPNVLYDVREGLQRDKDPGNGQVYLGGLMNYITLDVTNLSKWFKGTAPYAAGSGVNAYSNNGYGVYFSDRRNNVNSAPFTTPASVADPTNLETGEYGFEDVVNPLSALGVPNGTLDGGEDVNANNAVDIYGQFPSSGGVAKTLPAGGFASAGGAAGTAGYDAIANVLPTLTVNWAQGLVNRTYLFRRALKLINGGQGNIVTPGLTVITENPLYIEGDWNWNGGALATAHAETSVIADSVTLLSNAWTDQQSFLNPYDATKRPRSAQSYYRLAIIAGKGMAFAWPSSGNAASDFGTDGGAHNFLRMLEGNGQTVSYTGAIATFYYSRQAVGTYKGGVDSTVYDPPTRNYNFDTDFLNPATLPPLTPVFRDINALGFSQELRPNH